MRLLVLLALIAVGTAGAGGVVYVNQQKKLKQLTDDKTAREKAELEGLRSDNAELEEQLGDIVEAQEVPNADELTDEAGQDATGNSPATTDARLKLYPLSTADIASLKSAAAEIGADPVDLAAVIYWRTRGRMSESAKLSGNEYGLLGLRFSDYSRLATPYGPSMSFAAALRAVVVPFYQRLAAGTWWDSSSWSSAESPYPALGVQNLQSLALGTVYPLFREPEDSRAQLPRFILMETGFGSVDRMLDGIRRQQPLGVFPVAVSGSIGTIGLLR